MNFIDEVPEAQPWSGELVLEPLEPIPGLSSNLDDMISEASKDRIKRDLEALTRQRRYVAMNPGLGLVRRNVESEDLT